MKVFKILDKDIHDHYIVIGVWLVVVLSIYANVHYTLVGNCHVLQPQIDCSVRGQIDRSNVTGSNAYQFVYIPANISYYHMDEYRQKPQYGLMHAEFAPNNNTGTYHYDTFNGVVSADNLFGVVSHIADNASTSCWQAPIVIGQDCFGFPDYVAIVIIWGVIIAGPYYIIKEILMHVLGKKRLKRI